MDLCERSGESCRILSLAKTAINDDKDYPMNKSDRWESIILLMSAVILLPIWLARDKQIPISGGILSVLQALLLVVLVVILIRRFRRGRRTGR